MEILLSVWEKALEQSTEQQEEKGTLTAHQHSAVSPCQPKAWTLISEGKKHVSALVIACHMHCPTSLRGGNIIITEAAHTHTHECHQRHFILETNDEKKETYLA